MLAVVRVQAHWRGKVIRRRMREHFTAADTSVTPDAIARSRIQAGLHEENGNGALSLTGGDESVKRKKSFVNRFVSDAQMAELRALSEPALTMSEGHPSALQVRFGLGPQQSVTAGVAEGEKRATLEDLISHAF